MPIQNYWSSNSSPYSIISLDAIEPIYVDDIPDIPPPWNTDKISPAPPITPPANPVLLSWVSGVIPS
jgi:hypothetical protein